MKKIITLALSAALALSLCACSGGEKPSTEPEKGELAKITLCLEWTPNTNHTGFFVAADKGYYKDAGLDVSIVQPSENDATSLCAAGKADFAITAQDTMANALAIDEPLGISAVAALLQHNSSGIISRAGEGLDSPAGLEGKVYSTWNSPVELAMIDYVMDAVGADSSKVTLIPNNVTDEPGALEAKQTDAIWVFYGWGAINAEVRDFDYDFFLFSDIDPIMDYYTPLIIANNDFLKNNPDLAKAFLSATAKGYEFAVENPKDAADILIAGDTTGSLKGSEELVHKSQEWMSGQYKAEVEQWGYIDPARWDAFYGWLTENELCENPLEPGTGFPNDYLS